MVTVTSGANSDDFPFDGQTVGAVRDALGSIYGIAPDAVATLNGARAGEDTVLPAGSSLSFSRTVAQKG